MRKKSCLLIVLFFWCGGTTVRATVLAGGNALAALSPLMTSTAVYTAANIVTFSQPVAAKAYDQQNGVLYVGLDNITQVATSPITIAPAGPFVVSKVQRAVTGTHPQFIPIASNATFFPTSTPGTGIDFMALSTLQGSANPNVAIVTQNGDNYLQQPNVIISSSDGSTVQGYSNIRAYDPVLGENGLVSTGVVQIEANQQFVFAAARPPINYVDSNPPAIVPQDFGLPNSGIAVLGVNRKTLFPVQLPAQPNDPGIKSAQLDQNSPQVVIQGIPVFVPNHVSLNWDDQLAKLYIGLQLATAGPVTIDVVTTATTCNSIVCPELGSMIDGIIQPTQACIDLVASSSCLVVTTAFVGGMIVTSTTCDPACHFETQSACDALILSSTCLILTKKTDKILVPRLGDEGDGAMSVVVGTVSPNGSLTMNRFMPGNILVNGGQTNIVGVKQHALVPLNLAAAHLKTMHASTGPSYLIINGGNGAITNNAFGAEGNYTASTISTVTGTVGNMIWALPLVDVGDPSNQTQGVLADKNLFNSVMGRFEIPATTNIGLTNSSDIAAQVGAGPLPVQGSTPVSGAGAGVFLTATDTIIGVDSLDMTVVGDTVYVALANVATSTVDDTGVFYSQALFDQTGKINSWTQWAKRGLPYDAFPYLPDGEPVRFIDVDATNGKMWAVDGDYVQAVVTTAWDNGQFLSPLPNAVNNALPGGCFSVLDLDQSTKGLGASTRNRYGLFGSINAVAFAITTTSVVPSAPYNVSIDNGTGFATYAPQGVITDYNGNQNFLLSSLPTDKNISINVLEYSRQMSGTPSNYFFAGTDLGLFVFADSAGNGFDVAYLSTCNVPPFSTGSWRLISTIAGSIVDIKTTGNALYVLAMQTQPSGPVTTLYRVAFADNVQTMFASPFVIAQTGVAVSGSDLSETLYFYGMQIVATVQDGSAEQLVLATNNGLFASHAVGGVQNSTNQGSAAWAALTPDNNKTQYYAGVAGIDTPIPTTAWPFSLQDPTGQGLYDRSSVYQVIGLGANPLVFNPVPFNSNSPVASGETFDQATYFWSDGARRFLVVIGSECVGARTKLQVIPYDVADSNVLVPGVLDDQVLGGVSEIFWIRAIRSTGIIMAGTNRGAIALE